MARYRTDKSMVTEGVAQAQSLPYSKGKHRVAASAYGVNGSLMYTGFNSYVKTHPVQAALAKLVGMPDRIYLHAEIDALVRAGGPVHTMVVTRVGKSGAPLPSRPCAICRRALSRAGVRRVYYVNDAGKITSYSP
jgi:tRNA(Arg) A34 adenosine deaminase TadA